MAQKSRKKSRKELLEKFRKMHTKSPERIWGGIFDRVSGENPWRNFKRNWRRPVRISEGSSDHWKSFWEEFLNKTQKKLAPKSSQKLWQKSKEKSRANFVKNRAILRDKIPEGTFVEVPGWTHGEIPEGIRKSNPWGIQNGILGQKRQRNCWKNSDFLNESLKGILFPGRVLDITDFHQSSKSSPRVKQWDSLSIWASSNPVNARKAYSLVTLCAVLFWFCVSLCSMSCLTFEPFEPFIHSKPYLTLCENL